MKNPFHRTLCFLTAIAALATLGWLLGRQQKNASSPPITQTTTPVIMLPAALRQTTLVRGAVPSPKPLEIHHADRYRDLLDAANRGDADGAYQLAQGRQACLELSGAEFNFQTVTRRLESMPASLVKTDEHADLEKELSKTRAKLVRLRESCIGPGSVSFEELNSDWARAAQLGSHDAQYEFALNPRLNFLSIGMDTERWREWRDSAPRYMNDLLNAGESRAALALATSSDTADCIAQENTQAEMDVCNQSGGMGMILPQDPVTAYTYYVLEQLLGDRANEQWVDSELVQLEKSLTPEEVAAARTEAQRRFSLIQPGH